MTLTIAICALALVLSFVVVVGAVRQASWTDHLNTLCWLGLVGVMVAIYTETITGIAAALAAAAFGALVALPSDIKHGGLRRDGTLFGAAFAGVMAMSALVFSSVPQAKIIASTQDDILLFSGQWAALAACGTSVMVALGVSRWRDEKTQHSAGLALVVGGALLATYFMSALRADVPTTNYVLPLSTEGGPAMWGLALKHGGAKALGLHAMLEVGSVNILIFCASAAAVLAGILSFVKSEATKPRMVLWLLTAGLTLAVLGMLIQSGFKPTLPDGSKYTTYAQAIGADLKIPKNIVAQGGFLTGKSIFVLWSSILADIALLTFAAVVALFEAVLAWRASASKTPTPEGASKDASVYRVLPDHVGGVAVLYARDFGVRAAMLVWLSWFLGALATWKMHSTYGFASSSEWTSLGVCVLISGLAWLGFARKSKVSWLLPAVMMVSLLWMVAVSFGFGVPPQTALRF